MKEYEKLSLQGFCVCSNELLLTGILRQQLDTEEYLFIGTLFLPLICYATPFFSPRIGYVAPFVSPLICYARPSFRHLFVMSRPSFRHLFVMLRPSSRHLFVIYAKVFINLVRIPHLIFDGLYSAFHATIFLLFAVISQKCVCSAVF